MTGPGPETGRGRAYNAIRHGRRAAAVPMEAHAAPLTMAMGLTGTPRPTAIAPAGTPRQDGRSTGRGQPLAATAGSAPRALHRGSWWPSERAHAGQAEWLSANESDR